MFRFPTLQELPSVYAALHWLLNCPVKAKNREVLLRARLRACITLETHGHWKAEGRKISRLLKKSMYRLPKDPAILGTVLHGLGEMEARSHVKFDMLLIEHLCQWKPPCFLLETLNVAAKCEAKTPTTQRFESIAFAQWLSNAKLEWNTLRDASFQIKRFALPFSDGRYGFAFVARIVLAIDPRIIDSMLSNMVEAWPNEGLSDQQMTALENAFVDTSEIRYHLAVKLTHHANRIWLLQRNINKLKELIGLENPNSKSYFILNADQFNKILPWAAQSLVRLYTEDKRGIGKRTSDLCLKLAKSSNDLLAQPFIYARQPERWQSIVTRAACAYLFALIVVASVPLERQDEVIELNKLAIEHSFKILCGPLPEQNGQNNMRVFDQLASRAVYQISLCRNPDDFRKQWGLAEDLSDFPRALALWSCPSLVEQYEDLATSLFRRVAQIPLSKGDLDLQLTRMILLLDCAIAYCEREGKRDLVALIIKLWADVYMDWQIISNQWAKAATMFANAVEQEGTERAKFLAEDKFADFYCRQLIEGNLEP